VPDPPHPCAVDYTLNEATLLLESRRKDEFIAALAHELRNPLAPIRAGIELLKRGGNDPCVVMGARKMMARHVDHIERLINDLLDISLIARGRLSMHFEMITLKSVLLNAIEACRPQAEAREQNLHIGRMPQDAVIRADATRLYEVLCNVLNNAIKYTPERGDIRIETQCEFCEVVIKVTDNGIGMTREEIVGVFEMFAQVQTENRRSDGLGMGLALARKLVALHGGRIEASSDGIGLGSEFAIVLPLASATPPAELPEEQIEDALAKQARRHPRMTNGNHGGDRFQPMQAPFVAAPAAPGSS
jgi:signal transduction histidine kinase